MRGGTWRTRAASEMVTMPALWPPMGVQVTSINSCCR